MKPASSKARRQDRQPADTAGSEAGERKTPDTDMQPDDAGGPASTGRATAAESAMKQTSKTGNETGSHR